MHGFLSAAYAPPKQLMHGLVLFPTPKQSSVAAAQLTPQYFLSSDFNLETMRLLPAGGDVQSRPLRCDAAERMQSRLGLSSPRLFKKTRADSVHVPTEYCGSIYWLAITFMDSVLQIVRMSVSD